MIARDDGDPAALLSRGELLATTWTDHERVTAELRAAKAVCDMLGNAGDALLPLAALALINPFTPLPELDDIGADHRNRSGTATHGSRSGFDWHRDHRVPLCRQCRYWGVRNENGAR